MTDKLRIVLPMLLFATLTGMARAAEPAAVEEQEVETSSPSTALPEEIVVTGQKLLRVLNKQIEEAEDAMYGLFNELNDDDRYDIHCRWEAPLGTRMRQRVCRPEFLDNADRAVAKDFLAEAQGFTSTNAPPVQVEMAIHYPVLEEKLKEVLVESPEFADAVLKHHELREELEQRRTQYFDDE